MIRKFSARLLVGLKPTKVKICGRVVRTVKVGRSKYDFQEGKVSNKSILRFHEHYKGISDPAYLDFFKIAVVKDRKMKRDYQLYRSYLIWM